MDPNNMLPQNNPRGFCSPGEEDVVPGSKNQQHGRPRLARSRRRRCRQTTSEQQKEDQARPLQVYKFSSRAPPTSLHSNGEGSLGLSRVPALMQGGNIVEILAKTASYLMQQEPPRCWVRDCTGLACSAGGHPRRHLLRHKLLGEDRLTSLIREALLSVDEDDNSSTEDTGTVSAEADTTSGDAPRSFAEEYSLAPLNTQKRDSARSFDQQVENYFNQL